MEDNSNEMVARSLQLKCLARQRGSWILGIEDTIFFKKNNKISFAMEGIKINNNNVDYSRN